MPRPPSPFTEEEKAYVCRFYAIDGPNKLADALERSYQVIQNLYKRIEKQGNLITTKTYGTSSLLKQKSKQEVGGFNRCINKVILSNNHGSYVY